MSDMMVGNYEVRDESLSDHIPEVNSLTTDDNYLLQGLPLDEVANQLGYTGSLEKFEFPEKLNRRPLSISNDAIKLVCLSENYNPSEARCFLVSKMRKQFSSLRDDFAFVTEQAKDQMLALGGELGTKFKIYRRITVDDMTPKASKDDMSRGYAIKEIGSQYAMDYSFSFEEVSVRLSRMFCYNKAGESIVIKPVNERYRFVVLRNVSEDNYSRIVKHSYHPNFVIKESWDCYSVVFVIPGFYHDDVSDAIAKALASEFEGILDDCIYISGTTNYSLDTERRGKFPIVEMIGERFDQVSDVMRNFICQTIKRRFDSIQSIKDDLKSTRSISGQVFDRDLAVRLFIGSLDGYYSNDEIKALLVGNGEHSDGNRVDRQHFSHHVFNHIHNNYPKTYKPIVEIPIFSDPVSIISFDDDEDEPALEANSEETIKETVEEVRVPQEESTEIAQEEQSGGKSFWGKFFK